MVELNFQLPPKNILKVDECLKIVKKELLSKFDNFGVCVEKSRDVFEMFIIKGGFKFKIISIGLDDDDLHYPCTLGVFWPYKKNLISFVDTYTQKEELKQDGIYYFGIEDDEELLNKIQKAFMDEGVLNFLNNFINYMEHYETKYH